ncbi:MAG: zinc ABC transporter substrate-binding protein [Candidatus Bathyarchaeota archaeon]|nr:zinc ABC transporter substrate-binding protein [Candidatus Bathyarchaeota archaeon]
MNSKQKIFLAAIIIIAIVGSAIAAALYTATPKTDKLQVVATFYPLAYLTEQIGGDQVQVTQLIPSNTEIHNWEPSASNIAATQDADIIIYNGAGADHWMEDDVLPALSDTQTRTVVETTSGLTLIANQEHEHEHEAAEEEHDHGAYDPHTWVSPYMAKQQAEKIYNALVQVDPEHESYYTSRWQSLEEKLEQLDSEYKTGLSEANKSAIFVSHEAFGYLASRYGFEQHGVIGLSADEQPSAATIAALVSEMKQQQIYVVYVDPVYSSEYANTIRTEVQAQTGHSVTILELYLMLGQTDNMDYLEQMQTNLTNLKTGLGAA